MLIPAPVKTTSFLLHKVGHLKHIQDHTALIAKSDGIKVYLLSIKSCKRLTSSMRNGSESGTTFLSFNETEVVSGADIVCACLAEPRKDNDVASPQNVLYLLAVRTASVTSKMI